MEHNPNLNAASNFRTERTGHLINEYTTIHMPDALRKETLLFRMLSSIIRRIQ